VTVLIVDDEVAAATALARVIARAGGRAFVANSFATGRVALETAYPDVLLVDVRLGDRNGLQLMAMAAPHVAKVAMTGHDDPVIEQDARHFGAAYLIKPVLPETLHATIEQQLNALIQIQNQNQNA
jgi:DNA-binding NtrC family response regulator